MSVRPWCDEDRLEGLDAEPELAVLRDGELLGAATVRAMPGGHRIEWVHTAPGVLESLAEAFPDGRLEVLVHDEPPEHAGFVIWQRQVTVEGSLAHVRRPARRHFTFRRYGELGRRGMLALLTLIWEDGVSPTGLSPEFQLADLLARGDTSLWRAAYYEGEPLGVILGLRLAGEPHIGVLLFIGVIPAMRGRGLGTRLHAEALWLLRAHGVRDYRDSTGVDNVAMRRIFAGSGCRETSAAWLLVRDADRPPAGPRPRLPLGRHVSLLRKVSA